MTTRNIEFAIYNSTYAGMSGTRPFKKIKKPSDVYKLPSDSVVSSKPVKIDKDRQRKAVEAAKKVLKNKLWPNS